FRRPPAKDAPWPASGLLKFPARTNRSARRLLSLPCEQSFSELRAEGVSQDLFERPVRLVGLGILAPAGGQAQVDPVGRPVTGPFAPCRIDEGFHKVHGVAVDLLPVRTE